MSDIAKLLDYETALLEISEAKGAFKIDPFEHVAPVATPVSAENLGEHARTMANSSKR